MHCIKGGMTELPEGNEEGRRLRLLEHVPLQPALRRRKNPFTLDSKAPAGGYQEFLMNEARYSRLTREFPERATVLFAKNEENAKERYEHLLKLVEMYDK